MKIEISITDVGRINLSGKVVVSDPCYKRNGWCMAKDVAVKSGEYATYFVMKDDMDWGVMVAAVIAVHVDYADSMKADWELYDCVLGVDSGQCGIFDDTIYPKHKKPRGKYGDENSFYGECGNLTLSDAQGGILKNRNGIVSSTGDGDGLYSLFCQRHKGECVALMIDYGLVDSSFIALAILNDQEDENQMFRKY